MAGVLVWRRHFVQARFGFRLYDAWVRAVPPAGASQLPRTRHKGVIEFGGQLRDEAN